MFKICICSLVLFFSVVVPHVSAQESTIAQKVKRVQYDGSTKTLYFVGESKWAAPSCPAATYVQIKGSVVPGLSEVLSIGLSAKMAGKNITFWGGCDANTDYFNAGYIILE